MTMAQRKLLQPQKLHFRVSSETPGNPESSLADLFANNRKTGLAVPKGELDFFRYMVDQIDDELMITDKKARIVFVNEATVKGLGYARQDILCRPVTDFFHDKITVRQWQKIYFSKIKRKKKPILYVINRVVKGGKVRIIQVTAVYMPYKSEGYVLTVGRDVTDQLVNQVELKTSEDRYRLLSEQATEGILMLNLNGIIFYANKAAAGVFKISPQKAIGMSFKRFMDKNSISRVSGCFRKVKNGKPSLCSGLNIKDQNGKITPMEFVASPVFIGKRVAQIQVIFRDMRQEREIASLIRESENMKTLQGFVAGTTREIQQPLKGLTVRLQSLIDKYDNRYFEYIGYKEFADIMRTLRTMNDQTKYCYETVNKIVSLSRRKANLERRRCSANSVVQEAVAILKQSLEVSNITLKTSLSSQLPPVAIGPMDLGQVLNNILTNAIQSFSSGGGTIQVTTKYQKAMNVVRIDCRDDGVGIPEEMLGHVFEPFFTTKSRGLHKSSGLGLSIVYSIVKTHHGEVSIKSDYRKGTVVTVILPVTKAKRNRNHSR
ncbi:MAG: PAS domain S-box protein [Candidatus Omnitrophica bacterium]|nr:PAS domain S-box protein [Candidatus Omnitrophota bacterium]